MKIEVYSPTIRRKEMDAVLTAMVEDKIGPGVQTKALIQTAREKLKFDYCLALRSPVFAFYLALKSLGLKKGQGVLVSALSPLYYAWVLEDLELTPIYCDVLSSTACIGRETVEKALAAKEGLDPRCVLLHHSLGFQSDGLPLSELGFPIIEDCSQSFGIAGGGASNANSADENAPQNSSAGPESVGVFTILGLEEQDMLTSGGGALLYAHKRRDAAVLRNLGDLPPEYGLPDMNAAMAVVQFKEAEKNLEKRKEIARLYSQAALKTRHKLFIQNEDYNNYAFPLILETGIKDVMAYARRQDIAVENAFSNTLIGSGMVPPEQCPEAYSLSLRTVLFPIYPRLSMADAGKVAKLILTLP